MPVSLSWYTQVPRVLKDKTALFGVVVTFVTLTCTYP